MGGTCLGSGQHQRHLVPRDVASLQETIALRQTDVEGALRGIVLHQVGVQQDKVLLGVREGRGVGSVEREGISIGSGRGHLLDRAQTNVLLVVVLCVGGGESHSEDVSQQRNHLAAKIISPHDPPGQRHSQIVAVGHSDMASARQEEMI